MMPALPAVVSRSKRASERHDARANIDPSRLVFVALLVLGAALVLRETRGLSFFGDEWDLVVDRRGLAPTTLLHPHGPHLVLVPILIYKLLLQLFGAGTYLPFRSLAALDLVVLAFVLGVICRRAWGKWWGLVPVLLLVTLGPGGSSLLWPFQTGYAIAVAAGLVSLVAITRDRRSDDVIACAALLTSLASGSQGIGFVVGAVVMLANRGDWRRRAWIILVPAIVYGLWYLKYGHQASETQLSLWNTSLLYALHGLSATIGGVVGVSPVSSQTGLLDISFGQPMALAAGAVLVVALWRGSRPPPLFWGALITTAALWFATSLSNTAAIPRPAADPRYLATNAVLLLVCLCTAAPRPRLRVAGVVAALAALVVVGASNASKLTQARTALQTSDVASRAELGALMILRGMVPASFSPDQPGLPGVLVNVQAGAFFDAVDSFGMIVDSPATLLLQSEATREGVDHELQRGELIGLSVKPTPGPQATTPPATIRGAGSRQRNCLIVGDGALVIRATPGTYRLAASGRTPLSVAIGRFATTFDIPLGQVSRGLMRTVRLPADQARGVPWRMLLIGTGGRVCRVAA